MVAEVRNAADYVFSRMKVWEDKIAQIDSITGRRITFREVLQMAIYNSTKLQSAGIEPGSVVGLLSENCLEYVGVLLAVWRAGATATLLPPACKSRELQHLLNTTKPKVLYAPRMTEEQKQTLESYPQIKLFESSLDEKLENESAIINTDQPPNAQLALLLSSSGTTGDPKNVMLNHSNIIASVGYLSPLLMGKDAIVLGLTPFCHAYGLGLLLMALCEGTTMVVMSKYKQDNFEDAFSKYKVTHFHTVPTFLIKITDGSIAVSKLKSLRYLFTSGGMANPKIQEATIKKLGGEVKLFHSFGLTEATHVVTCTRVDLNKPGSVGPLLPFTKAKIIGGDGEALEQGQKGELCIAGPTVMAGYYNNSVATNETLSREGWLRTGDLAWIDSEGHIYIIDRIKFMIKFQGYQVSSSEVEGVICRIPGVLDVAVVGVQHETYGEVPKAYVVRKGKEIHEKEIIDTVEKELSYYKWLRGGVQFVDTIPKSPLMKTIKRLLIK